MSAPPRQDNLGFIMLRHVCNDATNQYWIKCYHSIRRHYPENVIMIVDDNSNYAYVTAEPLYKTHVVQSEFPRRGELLPYYYFLHYEKLFDVAVILHDSAFINKHIDFIKEVENTAAGYKMLWEFEHSWDQIEDETRMINVFKDAEFTRFYETKSAWKGCFGCMSVITHSYLSDINRRFDLSKLLNCIQTRYNRCSFERVVACLMQFREPRASLLGNIHKYCPWELRYEQIEDYSYLPIIKVWTGR